MNLCCHKSPHWLAALMRLLPVRQRPAKPMNAKRTTRRHTAFLELP